jgi:hypothetical protein
MTPNELAPLLLDWICADGQVRARAFAEAGYADCPLGAQVWLPTRAVVHLQVVGAFPAATLTEPTGPALPVAPEVVLPTEGATALSDVERWLAWRITQARSPQIASLEMFHTRPAAQRGIPHGLALVFHNGYRAWLYFRHVTPAGKTPGTGPAWRVQPTV